jgi:hypothetical protein
MLISFLASRVGEGSFSSSRKGSWMSEEKLDESLVRLKLLVEEKMVGSLVRLDLNQAEEKNSPQLGSPKFPMQLTSRG